MNKTYIILAATVLALTACSGSDGDSQSDGPVGIFPDYSIVNAPSDDPAKPWFIRDYFMRDPQWQAETTDYSGFKMGMYELTQYPDLPPTAEQQAAAEKLIKDSFDVAIANGWFDKEKGLSDDFKQYNGDPVHFMKREYVYDGITLDPTKPEVLMYYPTEYGDFLMGVMYLAIGERGPQVAGPLSLWHYHIDRSVCYELGVMPIGRYQRNTGCKVGVPVVRSPEMLHVWFFDHPDGRFATTMGLTQETLALGVEQIRETLGEQP